MAKKKVKVIKINPDECNGCRACEAICAAFHAEPKYSSVNPAKSRIHVHWYPLRNLYVPVYGGPYAEAECLGRDKYIIDGKEYDECLFCRATACPSRKLFQEPGTGLPLKCDMCESDPPQEEPLCVQVCLVDALTYEEREEEVEEVKEEISDLDVALEEIVKRFGWEKVIDSISRMTVARTGEEGE